MGDKSRGERRPEDASASSTNEITPYSSVQSFTSSPLRTDANASSFESALSPTPLPSPIHGNDEPKIITNVLTSASIGTATEYANRDLSTQTSFSIIPPSITQPGTNEFSGQTSLIPIEDRQSRAEIEVQTMSSTDLLQVAQSGTESAADMVDERNTKEVGAQTTQTTAEFGMQTVEPIPESSIAETSLDSMLSSVDEVRLYDEESDQTLQHRPKKLTKKRTSVNEPELRAGSSYILPKVSHSLEDYGIPSYGASASVDSQGERNLRYSTELLSTTEATTGMEELSSQFIKSVNETESLQDSDMPAKRPVVKILVSDSSSSLSSEPNFEGGLTDLDDGILYMIVPPDGGYGWFIVLMSFLCQVVVDGIIFSVGILLPYIGDEFGQTDTTIVLVASIQVGCYFIVGPVASAFINRFGFRPVALVGSVCSIVFILIGTYSDNIVTLIFFYSVLGGPSLSLIWVSSQLIVGYYFERYRPIANGVSCAGAGAGILIFSFMNAIICPKIGWRNASRIHTALLLCVLLMTITYIEVTPTPVATVEKEATSPSTSVSEIRVPFNEVRYSQFHGPLSAPITNRGLEQMIEVYDPERLRTVERMCPCCYQRKRSASADTQVVERDDEVEEDVGNIQGRPTFFVRLDPIEREDLFYTGIALYESDEAVTTHRCSTGHRILIDKERAPSIEYSLSVMRAQRQHRTVRRTVVELRNRHKYPYLAFISPRNWMPSKMFNAFAKLFDMNMLSIMEFRLLVLSAFFFPMGFNIPFVYSSIRAEVDPFNSSLISPTIGLSNFIFRIISGFAANKYRSQTTYICGGGIVFGGLAVLVSAFYGEDVVWFQYTYAACYGVAPAFFSTLRAIIYVRVIGLEKLTNAFGLTTLAMGLGVFLGTTAAAILNDLTHHYNAAFAFSGVCLIMAGALKLILPTLIRQRTERWSAEWDGEIGK
ncbi:uncharacterized protein LOC128866559 isoform X1 [Anastrepha ludens]|uniref:uncharacterized protein LOC128866559 isoform X1 n=1 Tax=Anastrepha ludens TaxID=28586 RepID=UPI0023B1D0BE|nr:uncharacterized protein LOC128866559 isoform X1 [Anastrepha ludens]